MIWGLRMSTTARVMWKSERARIIAPADMRPMVTVVVKMCPGNGIVSEVWVKRVPLASRVMSEER